MDGLVETWLEDDHALPGIEILCRLRDEHAYRGGKRAVYELVRWLRPPAVAPLVRFEGVPGEFSQHDFGQVDVRYTSGVIERVHFFASRLKSRDRGPRGAGLTSYDEDPDGTGTRRGRCPSRRAVRSSRGTAATSNADA